MNQIYPDMRLAQEKREKLFIKNYTMNSIFQFHFHKKMGLFHFGAAMVLQPHKQYLEKLIRGF